MRVVLYSKYLFAAVAAILIVALPSGARAGASGALISLVSAQKTVMVGKTVTVDVRENSGTTPVGAIVANVEYPVDLLTVTKVDVTTSSFTVADEEAFDAGDSGSIVIARRTSETGVTGNRLVARITFTGKEPGSAVLRLGDGTTLIGTNGYKVPVTTMGTNITVTAGTPSPTPTPTRTPTPSPTHSPTPTPGHGGGGTTPTPSPTDEPSPAPDDAGEAIPDDGANLPDTGATALGGAMGLSAVGYSVHTWRRSRMQLKDAMRSKR